MIGFPLSETALFQVVKFLSNGKITLHENTEARVIDFPYREMIEQLQDTGLFSKIMKSFMRGRDEKFIA